MKKLAAPEIDFADAGFKSFEVTSQKSTLYLNSWDDKVIRLIFFKPIGFSFKIRDILSEFYEISNDSPFLLEVLSRYYEKIPQNHPFKVYQIIDINDLPVIEIVAESVSVQKIMETEAETT